MVFSVAAPSTFIQHHTTSHLISYTTSTAHLTKSIKVKPFDGRASTIPVISPISSFYLYPPLPSSTRIPGIPSYSIRHCLILFLYPLASWCSACVRDAPAVAILVDRLADLDLSLHKLSIDANEADWRLHLARKETSKEVPHYVVAEPRYNPFLTAYGINSVPRYLLVDREGRILIDKLQGFHTNLPFLIGSVRETLLSDRSR